MIWETGGSVRGAYHHPGRSHGQEGGTTSPWWRTVSKLGVTMVLVQSRKQFIHTYLRKDCIIYICRKLAVHSLNITTNVLMMVDLSQDTSQCVVKFCSKVYSYTTCKVIIHNFVTVSTWSIVPPPKDTLYLIGCPLPGDKESL